MKIFRILSKIKNEIKSCKKKQMMIQKEKYWKFVPKKSLNNLNNNPNIGIESVKIMDVAISKPQFGFFAKGKCHLSFLKKVQAFCELLVSAPPNNQSTLLKAKFSKPIKKVVKIRESNKKNSITNLK